MGKAVLRMPDWTRSDPSRVLCQYYNASVLSRIKCTHQSPTNGSQQGAARRQWSVPLSRAATRLWGICGAPFGRGSERPSALLHWLDVGLTMPAPMRLAAELLRASLICAFNTRQDTRCREAIRREIGGLGTGLTASLDLCCTPSRRCMRSYDGGQAVYHNQPCNLA
jgi:hypothetical protein